MSKRITAVLLIILGIAAVIGAVLWTIWPILQQRKAATPSAQPPALPTSVPFQAPAYVPTQPNIVASRPTTSTGSLTDLALQELVKRQATQVIERIGTGTSQDGFASMTEVATDVTPDVRTYLLAEQKKMQLAHPSDIFWSQTTRVITKKVTTALPILTKDAVTILLRTQRDVRTGSGDERSTVAIYEEVTVELKKQGDVWLVSHLETKPYTP